MTASQTLAFEVGGRQRALELVRSPRARALRLIVDPRRGAVRLTLPPRASLGEALRWVETKRGWVEAQLAALPQAIPFQPGSTMPFRGEMVTIAWSGAHPRRPCVEGGMLQVGGPREGLDRRLHRWLRDQARQLLADDSARFAAIAGVSIGRVAVGDPVSRWGSCSARGDIRYSWRLVLAPDFVREATAAHEVAHRLRMDHSPAFHACVARLYGSDPAPARRWLRQHGAALHAVGRAY